MPRRDGYPTNQERLADFTAASAELFADLYDATLGDFFSPTFDEKPLSHLRGRIIKRYFKEGRLATSVTDETLALRPMTCDYLTATNPSLRARGYSPDVLQYYSAIAKQLGRVALKPKFNMHGVIPSSGIVAQYTALYPNGSRRVVDTFSDRLAKQTIVSAQYFVEEAKNFLHSAEAHLPPEEREVAARERGDDGMIINFITLDMKPDLPLSGRENTAFLVRYRDAMFMGYYHAQKKADSYNDSSMKKLASQYKAAARRAQAILDTRQ